MDNLQNSIQKLRTKYKQFAKTENYRYFLLILLLVSLGFAVYLVQHQQDIRNRAAGVITFLDASNNSISTANTTNIFLKIAVPPKFNVSPINHTNNRVEEIEYVQITYLPC